MHRALGPRAHAIYETLRRGIEHGEYPPGMQLPSQSSLARSFGVAMMTVSQAYMRLQDEGFVTTRQGRGAFVRTGHGQTDSQSLLRGAVEASPMSIISVDLEGMVTSWNRAAELMYGWRADEVLSHRLPIIPLADWEQFKNAVLGPLSRGEHLDGRDTRRLTKSGRFLDVHVTAAPIWDQCGHVVGAMALTKDISDRKRAEEALRDSEQRYRRIVEIAEEGVWIIDDEGITTFVNQKMASMLGCTINEIVGSPIFAFMDGQGRALVEKKMERRRRGISEQYDFRFQRKDGTNLWALMSTTPIFDADGSYEGALAMVTDITARKEMETSLRRSEQQFRAIVEHAPIGIALRDLQGRFMTTNRRYWEMIGYSEDELSRMSFKEYTEPEDLVAQLQLEEELLAGGSEAYHIEKRYIHKNGSTVWVSVTVTLVRDEDGRPLFLVGSVEDITARIDAREALRESRERFESAFAHAVIGMALVGLDGRWLQVNEALCHIVGYAEDELLTQNFQDITHPEDLDSDLNYIRQLLAGEIRTYQMEKRYFHKNGSVVWVLLSVSLVHSGDGTPLYFISQIQDITEKKLAQKALEKLLAERTAMLEVVEYRALHDPLTDLPNRALLYDRLEQAIRLARRDRTSFALLLMDLDGFKVVNDTLGHHMGDRLLVKVAKQLRSGLRETDTVARLGGDEFALVLPGANEVSAATLAQNIVKRLEEPLTLDGHRCDLSASVGVAAYPSHGDTAEVLLQRADIAMYLAKRAGRGVSVYRPEEDADGLSPINRAYLPLQASQE